MEQTLMASLIKARALQLYYHYCHNLVQGEAFHSDHGFFAESYAALERDYDSLAEYFICSFSNKAFKTKVISELVHEQLDGLSIEEMSPKEMYNLAQKQEEEYQEYLTKCNKGAPMGLSNLLQGLATASDVRLYKIKQRSV
jgi:DNA-binding ferritin-like protein